MTKAKSKSKVKAKARAKAPVPAASSRARSSDVRVYRLRRSTVHGSGLFAARVITKGEEIIEYAGERITHAEADRRHADKADDDAHTFLFTIDAKVVVDGGVDGNDARFINHSCAPNCEVINEDGRLVVEAIRTIKVGEELAYDYSLTRDPDDEPEIEKVFACRCGAATCRGTMLAPRKKPKVDLKSPSKPSKAKKNGGRKRAAA